MSNFTNSGTCFALALISARRLVAAFFLLVLYFFACSAVAKEPLPIGEKERQFLIAFNTFGYPGSGVSPPELHEAMKSGCINQHGVLVQKSVSITVDGYELTCMVQSGSEESGNIKHIWLPSRYARYCDAYESFIECANASPKP